MPLTVWTLAGALVIAVIALWLLRWLFALIVRAEIVVEEPKQP
jgi:hypothetical protein